MADTFASIAQMESSRFVGGRAQTQALLLAPVHAFLVPRPGIHAAVTERNQPCVPVAAVSISRPARALPPTHSSLASSLAEALNGASALSSELPSAGDRQAVAAIGPALVATADRDSMNATTLRVVAASSITAKSKSVSARA